MKHILIAGGSGLIGSAIRREAGNRSYKVTILSREPGQDTITWDPTHGKIDLQGKLHFDAVINLAGANVSSGRWTDERKKEILESRISSAKTLENYLFDGRITTDVYVGSSGIGIYGDRGKEPVTEKTSVPKTRDWFINLAKDWEAAHQKIAALEIRTVILRTGIVLSMNGGALKEILDRANFGVLPYFSDGQQLWSWLHIDDMVSIIYRCIENENMKGIYIASSPNAVSNKKFIQEVKKHLRPKSIVASVPSFVMKVMMGESYRVVRESCNAIPQRLINEKYQFRFPTIGEALADLSEME